MQKKISPSVMCADFFALEKTIRDFEALGIELIHVDIMDGSFVPNFTLGTDFIKALKKNTEIPLDIHLMIENPEDKLDWFGICEGEYVAIHYESTKHVQRCLAKIRELGGKPMLAINPATPLCVLENVLNDIDAVLVMTVNPGFAGQKMVPHSIDKIAAVRKYLDDHGKNNVEIEVDGNVSIENAIRMRGAGADIFVLGTSSVFKGDMVENIKKFRSNVF